MPLLLLILKNHCNYFKVFSYMLKGLPPIQDRVHSLHLILGSVPPNIRPYRYPYAYKSEINL